MDFYNLRSEILEELHGLPLFDVHTHLVGGRLGARGLHDIILYHMAISDLYAAGCPSGARLTQYPGWPTVEEAHFRIKEAIAYLEHTRNTAISHGARTILRDLYGVDEPVTEENWERLDSSIRERADDRFWQREIIRKAGIAGFGTELARREGGVDDDLFVYALEWAFFTRCQWGEYDTALYELERCWGKYPDSPLPIGSGTRPAAEKVIRTPDDVLEAVRWYVDHIPADHVRSIATHISTDIDLKVVNDDLMSQALANRDNAGPVERDIYAGYVNEAFLTAFERIADKVAFQFSFGAEPLPYETSSRLSQNTIAGLADMISRHPKIRFQCFLSSRHANQSMCTLARELPNLSLVGYWWHNFFPSIIKQIMEERLDMLPVNKQIGFFSDAYCVEWAYAKARIVRSELAGVLAEKTIKGQYTRNDAIDIARKMFMDTPKSLLGISG